MSGLTTQLGEANGAAAPEAPRSFKATLLPRLRAYREAADDGSLAEGSVWLVRVIEAGRSLNGPVYTEAALRDAAEAAIFEGVPVFVYSLDGDPEADDAGHLDDETAEAAPAGLVGHQVGSLEGVHFNEEAKSLDAYLKLYDGKLRERMVAAYKLGDIGEGGERDVFGLSIDANGDQNPKTGEVIRFTSATSVDVVNRPAAGGRIRRLVARWDSSASEARIKERVVSFSTVKVKLREAAADLERAARMRGVFSEAMDRLRRIEWSDEYSLSEQADQIAMIASDLAESFSAAGGEPMQAQEAQRFVEAAATFAAELKLMADALSSAPDDQAGAVLAQIKQAVDEAVSTLGDSAMPAEEPKEQKDEEADMATNEGANAQQDDFARMSAGLTEVLQSAELDPKVRKKLVAALGHEPNETPEQREIRALKEQLRAQAVENAFEAMLREGVAVQDKELVLSLIDGSKVKVDGTKVTGLKEAVEAVLEQRPYLRVAEVVETQTQEAAQTEDAEGQGEQDSDAEGELVGAAAGASTQNVATQESLATGVSLRESVGTGTRAARKVKTLTAQRRALLEQRAMQGDVRAVTELRHARGHRY